MKQEFADNENKIKELIAKKNVIDEKIVAIKQEYKPVTMAGKIGFAILRGLITGAKYAKMAAVFISDSLKSIVKIVLMSIAMAFYVPYLAIRNYKESKENSKVSGNRSGFFATTKDKESAKSLLNGSLVEDADFSINYAQ